MNFIKYVVALAALTLLVACGGGGGNPGTYSGGPQPVVTPTMDVQIFNSSNAVVTNAHITADSSYYVKATLKNPDGAPIGGQLVTFSVSPSIASLASATARTDSTTGEAKVAVYPTTGATGGAASLQATAIIGTTTVTGTLVIEVASPGIPIGPQIAVQLFNASNVQVSNVTFGGGNYVQATFKDASGAPIVNRLLTFSLNGATIALLSAPTALTNSSGAARVSIAPASVSTVGAATLSAQTIEGGLTYSASTDFGVSPAAITLGPLTLGSSALTSGGNTSVTISAMSNAIAAAGVNVALTADCGTINPVATTDGSGMATATYSAVKTGGSSCNGAITLTASASGATGVQKTTLSVAAPVANAINFVSATPAQIFVKSSGAAEQSVALFKVLDSTGVAMPNIPVVFSLTMNPGGVGLGASGALGNVTANSDALGIASVSVFSGTIPGPVEVTAALASNPSVFTTSKNLTVASGPPSQNHFSLSVETFNIEGWNLDGSSTNLTVRVADRQGNPVPDGTVINFTAEGGQVAPSCATKLDAANHAVCSVAFISQNPRPLDGRVSVLAYAEGLKEYIDVNGNNAYDAGIDNLVDLGDAYRDDNENGQYDIGEFVIPKGGVTVCVGAGGAFPARANTCTGATTQATTVRQQAVLLFASSSGLFTLMKSADNTVSTSIVVRLNSADHTLLPMPAGTEVSVEVAAGGTVATSGGAVSCATTVSPSVVPNTSLGAPSTQLGSIHTIGLTGCGGSTLFINATTPIGKVVTSFTYIVPVVPPSPIVCTPPQTLQNAVCVNPDTTAPTSLIAVNGITTTGVTLIAQLDEVGTGYYKVQLGTDPAPSVGSVRLTGTAVDMSGNTPVNVAITGLATGTSYTIYFLAKDATGNTQATVSSVTFTTL